MQEMCIDIRGNFFYTLKIHKSNNYRSGTLGGFSVFVDITTHKFFNGIIKLPSEILLSEFSYV